jgi:hypothetical protein
MFHVLKKNVQVTYITTAGKLESHTSKLRLSVRSSVSHLSLSHSVGCCLAEVSPQLGVGILLAPGFKMRTRRAEQRLISCGI